MSRPPLKDADRRVRDWRHRARVLEAMFALTIARLMVDRVHFRRIAPLLGDHSAVPPHSKFDESARDEAVAGSVKHALSRAAIRLPWDSSCLVRTLAGSMMLKRRDVPTLACFGVAPSSPEARAHAWLIAGGIDVSGGNVASKFSPIATFSSRRKHSQP